MFYDLYKKTEYEIAPPVSMHLPVHPPSSETNINIVYLMCFLHNKIKYDERKNNKKNEIIKK